MPYEFWRPTDSRYHAAPPGIAVETTNPAYHQYDPVSGLYMPAVFPVVFRGMVQRALHYLNQTQTGATILWALHTSPHTVQISPSSLGNTIQTSNQQNALSAVAAEILGAAPGVQTQTALATLGVRLNVAVGARMQWLAEFINASPSWSLQGIPGTRGNFLSLVENVRQQVNRWMLLVDRRYMRWSDSNEGYFNAQTFGGPLGVRSNNINMTAAEVGVWIGGGALPARLSPAQRDHARISTIVALKDDTVASMGSPATVRWNATTNPLNSIRPPVIGLGHELIHAYYSVMGLQSGHDDSHFSTVLFEYRCVGLGPWDENAISENSLRKEWWSYAVPHIPVNDRQNRKAPAKRITYN